MHGYEIEVKSLLGNQGNADALREKLKACDPATALTSKNKQLNHYFEPADGSLDALVKTVGEKFPELKPKLDAFNQNVTEYSVRTREKDGTVLLVIKASIDATTSSNGIARKEFEEAVPASLDELDQLVLSAGFAYQAKWSREREEYLCRGINVTLDKNAGYGWLAEFELVVDDESKASHAQSLIRSFMMELGVEELPQERLARMFDYYNKNWPNYYGTDNIFTVE